MGLKYPQRALDASYNNVASGLAANNVQEALDEVAGNDWVSWTPTGTWTANATYTGHYRVANNIMYVRVGIALSGTPTPGGALYIDLPAGFELDTSVITGSFYTLGGGCFNDASPGLVYRVDVVSDISRPADLYLVCSLTSATHAYWASVTNAVPVATPATNDYVRVFATFPVVSV